MGDLSPKVSPELAGLLACPRCGAGVTIGPDSAVCSKDHRYPAPDGIPVFVGEETLAADPQYAAQRRHFGAEFGGYDAYRLENWRRSYIDRLRASGALGVGAGPIVDVGVGGSGYTVIEAARSGQKAIGCDLAPEALVAARGFAGTEGLGGTTLWVCCSAERLPLASESFASALAIAVLEHVPDDRAALREAARVVRRGGHVWVTVPHAIRHVPLFMRLPNRLHDRRLGHLRRYDAEHLTTMGSESGLEVVDVRYTGHSIKVLQLGAAKVLRHRSDRFWWWCERRDLRNSDRRRGSMQLSIVFRKR